MFVDIVSENFLTFSILFILSVLMIANRKTQIPATRLFPIGIAAIALISLSASASKHIDLILPQTAPNQTALTVLAIFRYIARPCVIFFELTIIVPDLKYKVLAALPLIFNSVIYLISPFAGELVFRFEGPVYMRFTLGLTTYYVLMFYVVLLCFCSFRRFGRQSKSKNMIVISIAVLSVITAVLEVSNVEPSFVEPVTALSILTYYIYLSTIYQQEMRRSVAEKELRIEQDTLKLLRAQIQPHFIYNTLGVMRSLIRQDQRVAVKCLDDFADYLKGHIRAIQSDEPIPFEKEVENVEAYLALVRSDHYIDLEIVYDFREKHFDIPALTLEPIVENAIKHGISENGGRITIKTFSRGDSIVITVEDSGSDREIVTEREKDRLGVGLENTRRRLQLQCGGELELTRKETGAVAEIVIPRKRGDRNEDTGGGRSAENS